MISLGKNIQGLATLRALDNSSDQFSRVLERLSSGSRINRASDDAAGLSVALQLDARQRTYTRGLLNISDSLSAISIATSTVEQLSTVVTRLRELATQAANGAFSDVQRQSLNTEAQQLKEEFFRISRSARFNGLGLFDGSLDGLRTQLGFGVDGSIYSSFGGKLGTGTFSAYSSLTTESARSNTVATGDFNGDGIIDMVTGGNGGQVTVSYGNGDGSFYVAETYSAGAGQVNGVRVGDLDGDGVLDIAAINASNGAVYKLMGDGSGQFEVSLVTSNPLYGGSSLELADMNGDGALDIVTLSFNGFDTFIEVLQAQGGDFSLVSSIYDTEVFSGEALAIADVNGDGQLDIAVSGYNGLLGGSSLGLTQFHLASAGGTFTAQGSFESNSSTDTRGITLGDLNGDGILDLVAAGGGGIKVFAGDGTGGFSEIAAGPAGLTADVRVGDINGDGLLDIVSVTDAGGFLSYINNGTGEFESSRLVTAHTAAGASVTLADVNGDGVLDALTAGDSGPGQATTLLGDTRDGISPLVDFSLSTLADARQAMSMFAQRLELLSRQQGVLGAYESRLLSAQAVSSAVVEGSLAAKSRITDADIAFETAEAARLGIVRDAGAAVLAQANQQPALALTLLRT